MYYVVLAFQAYCLYHAYTNRSEYYWWFVIIFLPVIGCLLYLFVKVFSRRKVDQIQDEIGHVINPSKKVNDLEQKLQFADTFQNRVDLADAYRESGDFTNAIPHYEMALRDSFDDDPYVIAHLIQSYFKLNDFDKVLSYAERIKGDSDFNGSRSQFIYGLALEKLGRFDEAESALRHIDQRYCNYEERLVLAQFLISRGKKADAKDILNEVHAESQNMTRPNRRKYRLAFIEVERLKNELDVST